MAASRQVKTPNLRALSVRDRIVKVMPLCYRLAVLEKVKTSIIGTSNRGDPRGSVYPQCLPLQLP